MTSDLLHLVFLSAMLLVLVGGMVAILVLWYVRGRDPHTGPVADYLAEPPDDLPPGAAGTLLDEHAEHHDVVATMLGLARHGAVEIAEIEEEGRRDFTLIVVHPERVKSRLERDLLHVLVGPDPQPLDEVRLSEVRPAFTAAEPKIRHDLYLEMVDRGYFRRSPDDTRRLWRRIAWAGIVGSIVLGIVLTILTDAWALLPAVAGVIVWAGMLRVSRRMPQKTREGAEAAAKWRAFRTYLQDITKYESVETATDLFDRYLAYAVAFRLERQWVETFRKVGADKPGWYHQAGEIFTLPGLGGDMLGDAMTVGRMAGHTGSFGGGLGDVSMPDLGNLPGNVGIPDMGGLQGASDLLGGGLQGASDGLFDMLDGAGSVFDAIDFDF